MSTKPIMKVWGPSVPHSSSCFNPDLGQASRCVCPKKRYCEGCDAQHSKAFCPRTVLDDMVEAMEFGEKSLKRLIIEILDSAEARHTVRLSIEDHIKGRIDELVARHGNLGVTRKKLRNMAKRELNRRWRRAWRQRAKDEKAVI